MNPDGTGRTIGSEPDPDEWHYLPTRTRAGALQRGLGRGAFRARFDPAAPDLVNACIRRDHRWLWACDERGTYLARLVRDLGLPVGPLVSRLYTADDENNEFTHVLEVLTALGRAEADEVIGSLRRYVQIGPNWSGALEAIARNWPANWWDDLLPVAMDRLGTADGHDLRWTGLPWTDWTGRDERLRATRSHDAAQADTYQHDAPGPGPDAVPAARAWVTEPGSSRYWLALTVLARHGDESDGPALLAGLDWLDRRPDDLCGYDRLIDGLVRIGGEPARAALPRIRRLWFSPHSYERASYLRARLALEPEECAGALTEGLWDCEPDVRLLAVRQVPADARTKPRLTYLRDDPIETSEVREAAAERLMLEASAA
ncbi:hypothetical protein GCM10010399_89140 [Dactylosporangium fulvum]|uniref:HEAT repeat domain-containing protein n=1 Tax=Dactylosporangium fulvum TaxID=53359 RepID=A0ABY5W632_9ACTN|nr:hypothetical protein [Dactylosporangium fulvum]UWP84924.1 hypothetical protein Dfulv_12115 [Dactylosporangium fulvum]